MEKEWEAQVQKYKTMVKLSAPREMEGMLGRKTFAVPDNMQGARLITWWEKAANDKRVELLKYAEEHQLDVVEALEKVQCAQ